MRQLETLENDPSKLPPWAWDISNALASAKEAPPEQPLVMPNHSRSQTTPIRSTDTSIRRYVSWRWTASAVEKPGAVAGWG